MILGRDYTGQTVAGVPVTANGNTILHFLCDEWVEEVFVSLPESYGHPAELISDLAGMGIVVHVEMEQLDVEPWQRQTIQKVAGTTVRTVSMIMATPIFSKIALASTVSCSKSLIFGGWEFASWYIKKLRIMVIVFVQCDSFILKRLQK